MFRYVWKGCEFLYNAPYKNKELADKVLEEWDDICKELEVTHFLSHGTCLGFIRDKNYIEGDNDLDVGISGNIERVEEKLVDHGFKSGACWQKSKHFFKHGILLDIWYDHTLVPYSKYVESFDEVEYNGRIYNVPHPVKQYLDKTYPISKYKVSWKVPVLNRHLGGKEI